MKKRDKMKCEQVWWLFDLSSLYRKSLMFGNPMIFLRIFVRTLNWKVSNQIFYCAIYIAANTFLVKKKALLYIVCNKRCQYNKLITYSSIMNETITDLIALIEHHITQTVSWCILFILCVFMHYSCNCIKWKTNRN